MTNSTQIITDLTSVITNGPNAATSALANVASGAIMDYAGNVNLLLLKAQEMQVLITAVIADTDASDTTNLNLLNGVKNDLV
jgi:hypothetical protein